MMIFIGVALLKKIKYKLVFWSIKCLLSYCYELEFVDRVYVL